MSGAEDWAEAVVERVRFFVRRRRGRRAVLRRVRAVLAAGGLDRERFQAACLEMVAVPGLDRVVALARQALAGDAAAGREVEAAAREDWSGALVWAAQVPARVVWLDAMARTVPEEAAGAAAMLVNDLAAVGRDLPLRALEAAVARGRTGPGSG